MPPRPPRRPPSTDRSPALPQEVSVDVPLDELDDDEALRLRVARHLGVPETELPALTLRRRAVDARGRRVRFHLTLALDAPPRTTPLGAPEPREVTDPSRVLIVGDGPAGLFCAYELARAGIGSTILERGKPVQPRRRDLALLNREGHVDPDSNYCFGEGGAGTYSDGKLYTRAGKRGSVRDVLELLVAHGAPEAILTEARPHIGSNKLPKVLIAIRAHLEAVGVAFEFGARVEGLLVRRRPGGGRCASGVRLAGGQERGADAVVVATGHSARDVYRLLDAASVRLEPKAFALGVRIEHPQPIINALQYGADAGHPKLPAAYYRLASQVDDRGVFSFCMCPGGFIVPAATEPGGQVVNGMSLSRRDSPYANSGLVVSVEPSAWQAAGFDGPLGGVAFQQRVERAAFEAGGRALRAPATRATDFVAGRGSSDAPASSYRPGLCATDLTAVLDSAGVAISAPLRAALADFGRRMPGFVSDEAVLVGVESRTSAPVRVPRRPDTLEAVDLARLYPAGEGAGYAGGIMSAALDGIHSALAIVARHARD